jgi:hypothetical protein
VVGRCSTLVVLGILGGCHVFRGVNILSIFCFAGVCCLVLGKWFIFSMYGGADCPRRLMVGVNDLLYVALECFCTTVVVQKHLSFKRRIELNSNFYQIHR